MASGLSPCSFRAGETIDANLTATFLTARGFLAQLGGRLNEQLGTTGASGRDVAGEAVTRFVAAHAPDMVGADSPLKMAVLPGTIEMVVGVATPRAVTDPLIGVGMYVRSCRVALFGIARTRWPGTCAANGRGPVCRDVAAANAVAGAGCVAAATATLFAALCKCRRSERK